ncbi:MAG: putative ABC transporter ATP-binding protein YadG [Burkholderia gladioli]|nr:MAG: putative ABC transporter ATP-binding protein YadG [Burkholderia gladioli]
MSAIEIRNVKKRYQSLQALKGVSLSVEEGAFFGLLGPNGAGKTTLISILAGLARADEGSISVRGHDVVADFRGARRALGVVPQELVFDPFFSVRETLRIQSGYFGLRRNDDWIDEVMANLDLTEKADTNMRALSGGMKRRVLVAQALVHRPPVIVLDDPTAGVDVELRQTLWKFISRLNREGHTIVLTTHYLEEAESLCDRIAMLRRGEVVALERTCAAAPLRRAAALPAPVAGRAADRTARAGERAGAVRRARASAAAHQLRRGRTDPVGLPRGGLRVRGDRGAQGRPRGRVRPGDERSRCGRGVGMSGFRTLFYKEMLWFWKVSFQTVLAPVVTALLYLTIFGHALSGRVNVYPGVEYVSFLVPGLVMMSVLQNAFANSSSSLIQSKITGNLVFMLLPPLSYADIFGAYVLAVVVRGLAVGLGVFVVTIWFVPVGFTSQLFIVLFALFGSAILGTLGLIAGIVAEKFDQLAAFQNFLIMPLTFLSGVFYSTHSLPPMWREISRLNPFFYMIDGFRYGFSASPTSTRSKASRL